MIRWMFQGGLKYLRIHFYYFGIFYEFEKKENQFFSRRENLYNRFNKSFKFNPYIRIGKFYIEFFRIKENKDA